MTILTLAQSSAWTATPHPVGTDVCVLLVPWMPCSAEPNSVEVPLAVDTGRDRVEMVRIQAQLVKTQVVEDEAFGDVTDENCVREPMHKPEFAASPANLDPSVAARVNRPGPDPAIGFDPRSAKQSGGYTRVHRNLLGVLVKSPGAPTSRGRFIVGDLNPYDQRLVDNLRAYREAAA